MGARSRQLAIALGVAAAAGIAIASCSSAPDTTNAAATSGSLLTGANSASSVSASSSTAASSAGVGGSGGGAASASAASGAGGAGGAGGSGGAACDNGDPGEPNNDEPHAYKLGTIDCADGDGGNIYGVVADGSDVDWFMYTGDKSLTCDVDAFCSIVEGAGSVRVCQYFECLSGTTEVTCPAGTTADMSPNGRTGCCGTSDFDVTDLNCKGVLENNINVFIRVDDPTDQAMCLPYTLAYHY